MNDQSSSDDLPELSPEAIERIESAVFADISAAGRPDAAPAPPASRGRERRRRWLTGIGVAAAFVIGVMVTPPILSSVGGGGAMTASDSAVSTDSAGGSVAESGAGAPDLDAGTAPESAVGEVGDSDREIVATARATLRVKHIADAADAIAALAEDSGGYVETTEIGGASPVDGTTERVPEESGYGWISVRVPSSDLTEVISELEEVGDVQSSSISKQDVTSAAIDLRARVEATKASVQRLTELMAQSGSVSELIEAEVALTERQSQLESYEQQLAALEDQVSMSSLQVELTRTAAPTSADPAGFADGLLAGWNGLVVSLNALVIALGFVLPWIAVVGVVVLVIWLIRRARRGRRSADTAD